MPYPATPQMLMAQATRPNTMGDLQRQKFMELIAQRQQSRAALMAQLQSAGQSYVPQEESWLDRLFGAPGTAGAVGLGSIPMVRNEGFMGPPENDLGAGYRISPGMNGKW